MLNGKPRLLVLASTFPRWAGDHEPGFVYELSRRLIDKFEVTVLCPHARNSKHEEMIDGIRVLRYRYAPEFLETLVNDGGIVTNLRRAKWKLLLVPTFVLAQAWTIWKFLRRERFDLIHAHWLIPQGLIAALLQLLPGRDVPFLVTSHGADLYALQGKFWNALKRFVLRRAGIATVVSGAMLATIESIGADLRKVSVLPMGVDLTTRFTPDESVQRASRELLFVGRLVEKKGLRILIDAMPEILRSFPDARLTVAGFGPELVERQAQVEELELKDSVHFMGPLQQWQLPQLYRCATVFVAPFVEAASGDREGLGLVAVEAAGCGCPVVVSDFSALHDIFDSRGASFVKPGSSAMLAKAITRVLATTAVCDAKPDMRLSLADRFDWNSVTRRYIDALSELID